ncbi:MAG: RHS repeat-associated core domain-containing protein [Planctomycetaceae bacterium]|jgi:RHS repeat-associated protein|nr:RHS repeat-associated core domain-containing protein [Planctomycetaceae bacterium]
MKTKLFVTTLLLISLILLLRVELTQSVFAETNNPLGQSEKTEYDKTENHFVHDGWQIILQFENKEIKPTHRYLWGTKQDELICNNNNWTLGDHLNTIRDIVKSDGNVESHVEYNAFGKIISETKNNLFFFGYTGKLFDNVSDLQWNINRWYDSNAGRWISEDPIGNRLGDINLFRYVQNACAISTDSRGLLTDSNVQQILDKWGIQAANVTGPKNYIAQKYYENRELAGLNQVAADMILAGIPLPGGLKGQIAVATIKSILENILTNRGNEPISNSDIVQIIQNAANQVINEQHPLISVIRQLIDYSTDFSTEDCSFQIVEWTSDPMIPRKEKFYCNFWVCGKITNNWIIADTVDKWSISGFCNYECCSKNKRFKCPDFNNSGNYSSQKLNDVPIKVISKK